MGTKQTSDRTRKKTWLRKVKTVSTSPPPGLFTRDAEKIARTLASRRVSPKGIGSAILRLQFQINRSGRGLSPARRKELERAKRILQERHRR